MFTELCYESLMWSVTLKAQNNPQRICYPISQMRRLKQRGRERFMFIECSQCQSPEAVQGSLVD